jgi:DnaJ-class molecular chaperone
MQLNKYLLKYLSKKFCTARIKSKPTICYYKLLNLTPNSDFDEIKKEYYKLAKRYHPDNTQNSNANQIVFKK